MDVLKGALKHDRLTPNRFQTSEFKILKIEDVKKMIFLLIYFRVFKVFLSVQKGFKRNM